MSTRISVGFVQDIIIKQMHDEFNIFSSWNKNFQLLYGFSGKFHVVIFSGFFKLLYILRWETFLFNCHVSTVYSAAVQLLFRSSHH